MNKLLKRKLDAFNRVLQRSVKYHMPTLTPHEQAIREDIKRFGKKLVPLIPLLNQANKF